MGLWVCLGVISPFPFYYYLWTHPQKWVDLCGSGRDPCKVMAMASHFIKLIQFISLLSVSTLSWPPPLYFWPLFIFGQFLNFRSVSLSFKFDLLSCYYVLMVIGQYKDCSFLTRLCQFVNFLNIYLDLLLFARN